MSRLSEAVNQLYKVFAAYPLPDQVEMSPYRDPEKELGALRRKLLRQVTALELDGYARHALTTVGDEDLFKYALPRLLELVTERELLTDSEIVLSKLTYGDWRTWLEVEQQAIEEFLMAWWITTLAWLSDYADTRADDALSSIAQVEDNLAPYLDYWFKDESIAAVTHLIRFLDFGWREEGLKYEASAFWESRPAQTQQLIVWLYSAPVGQKISAGLAASSTFDLDLEVEDVYERVRTIIQHFRLQRS